VTDAALKTRQLTKVYGAGDTAVRALDDVSVEVAAGEMVAVMGPSGSGKSTLLHLLGALDAPTSGDIILGGQRYAELDDGGLTRLRRDRIGFVFQFFNLLPSLSAEENVLLPALIAGRHDGAVTERAGALLRRVGLDQRRAHRPAELSGGEQQRVSIARALLTEPELVLADEPTGNLDTRSTREVLELLAELNRSEAQTLVLVTHGFTDLVTPYFASELLLRQLPPNLAERAKLSVYPGGHMFYTRDGSRAAFRADGQAMIRAALDARQLHRAADRGARGVRAGAGECVAFAPSRSARFAPADRARC
jgi:putative ABC transport system ATP-binding protein